MLSQSIVNSGLAFTVNIDGHDINFKEWVATDDCIYFFPLANLADNGYALIDQHRCTVPFENLYLLDEVDRMVLGVPCAYDRAMRLRGEGMLNTSDFKYSLEFLSHVPDGDILLCERKGNIICTDGCKYLLSESQFELTKRIDQFNDLEEADKTSDFNFRFFADIKDLAIHSNCELDSYLENENVFVPDQIKITVGRDEEGFTIDPSVGIEENEKFQKAFERMRKVQGMYPVQKDNGERVRIVLNQGQKDSLSQLKSLGGRHKTREEIQEITDHPTEYFDPEVFDLSDLYSDRVIEIGVYKPKFYPFICPYKSCWVAGATVETPQNGTSRIYIETEEDLSQLINAIEDAKSQNKGIVHFKDTQIGLDDAAFLVEMGRKQMNSPRIPLKTDSNQTNAARNVLIIKDNAEEVAYTATESSIEKSEKYTLYKDPFLQDDFHLKVHQEEGIAWLQNLYQNKASGCLMADDMGLGKTLQVLYFIDWHSRMNVGHKPYLIVAPISLLENWENE